MIDFYLIYSQRGGQVNISEIEYNSKGVGYILIYIHPYRYREIKMIKEILSKNVTVYLKLSPLGNHEVKGKVIELDDYWLKIKGKKTLELINRETVKRITVHSK